MINEWKAKVDGLSAEIEASQKEMRNYHSESMRLRAAWEEALEQLEIVKRENKNLADIFLQKSSVGFRKPQNVFNMSIV